MHYGGTAMFIGHHAVAFAAKKAAPKISLGMTFVAVQFLDMLWPVFLLLGWEHARIVPGITVVSPIDLYDYPLSHSLVASFIWSFILGTGYYLFRKNAAGSVVVALSVFSHWILDFITHRPDMPVGFGNTSYVGLGLWNSLWGTLFVEIGLYAVGVWLYLRSTQPIDRVGKFGAWSLIGFLFVAYVASLAGGPPPNVMTLAIGGSVTWLFALWAFWIDKHRIAKGSEAQPASK